ncbi:hypothetical protein ACG59Z_08245 [Acinetobacter sp. ABJ_C1_1]|uniref:hypothetical protein n=1 Tax=Acinetobacter sp. ABJ_C1_1 TaxID=3378321 RepID=UPI0037DD3F6A
MNGFWRIFCIFHIFLGITSVFFLFLLVFYPIILGINLALSGLIYIIFVFIKKYKVNDFFNTILSLTFAISLSFLVSLIFLSLENAFGVMLYTAIYLGLQFFLKGLVED